MGGREGKSDGAWGGERSTEAQREKERKPKLGQGEGSQDERRTGALI